MVSVRVSIVFAFNLVLATLGDFLSFTATMLLSPSIAASNDPNVSLGFILLYIQLAPLSVLTIMSPVFGPL